MDQTFTLTRTAPTLPPAWNAVTTLHDDTKVEYFYDYAGQDPINGYDLGGTFIGSVATDGFLYRDLSAPFGRSPKENNSLGIGRAAGAAAAPAAPAVAKYSGVIAAGAGAVSAGAILLAPIPFVGEGALAVAGAARTVATGADLVHLGAQAVVAATRPTTGNGEALARDAIASGLGFGVAKSLAANGFGRAADPLAFIFGYSTSDALFHRRGHP